MGLGIWGLGFRASRFRDLGCGDLGFRVYCVRVWGLGFRDLGFRV